MYKYFFFFSILPVGDMGLHLLCRQNGKGHDEELLKLVDTLVHVRLSGYGLVIDIVYRGKWHRVNNFGSMSEQGSNLILSLFPALR